MNFRQLGLTIPLLLSYLLVLDPEKRKSAKEVLALPQTVDIVTQLKKRNLDLGRGRSRSFCRNPLKNVEIKRTASENRVLCNDKHVAVNLDTNNTIKKSECNKTLDSDETVKKTNVREPVEVPVSNKGMKKKEVETGVCEGNYKSVTPTALCSSREGISISFYLNMCILQPGFNNT